MHAPPDEVILLVAMALTGLIPNLTERRPVNRPGAGTFVDLDVAG
jgi:hypothetical protein